MGQSRRFEPLWGGAKVSDDGLTLHEAKPDDRLGDCAGAVRLLPLSHTLACKLNFSVTKQLANCEWFSDSVTFAVLHDGELQACREDGRRVPLEDGRWVELSGDPLDLDSGMRNRLATQDVTSIEVEVTVTATSLSV